jgi:hypothetical protein
MKRRYEATYKPDPAKEPAPGETRAMKREREIDRLTDEVETWRKRALSEGSLFDLKLKRDTVKEIAATIAGNVPLTRLLSLQKALAQEIVRLKAERKQAG